MNAQGRPGSSAVHPAPHRHKVSAWALWFAVLAGPLAWMGVEMIDYFTSSRQCTKRAVDTVRELAAATSPWFLGVTLAGLVIALIALFVAIVNWRKVRKEESGSGQHLLELGRGRTRFIAMWGLATSIGFTVAFAFTLAYMITAPLCGR
jgi:hypothetical protein